MHNGFRVRDKAIHTIALFLDLLEVVGPFLLIFSMLLDFPHWSKYVVHKSTRKKRPCPSPSRTLTSARVVPGPLS